MAALKLLFSSVRRHSRLHPSPFLRSLSSESDQAPPPPLKPHHPLPIEPVSYAPKPKPDPAPSPQSAQPQPPPPSDLRRDSAGGESVRPWSREDARFVKDGPSITPVSYPARVAPLPEDKKAEEGGGGAREEELEREKQRIEQAKRRAFRLEDRLVVPFPTFIKVEKKERKPILDLMDAIRQVKVSVATAKCNFDETVEAHVQLGIDAKRNAVRGNMTLPHGSGKVVRVAFFAEGADADEARAAGADIVGGVDLVEEIASSRKLNVDKCFATNEMVMRLAKIARILRERGLMPDRKLGTVTNDIVGALQKVRQGHIEYKMDRTSIVHVGLGKVSFTEDNLRENVGAIMSSLLLAKPTGLKKSSKYAGYINSFHICSTMGSGFPVSIQSLSKAADNYNKMHLK
uniref:50S ribosomal protein L1, chloroplastic isoform X1 n=1 Tax=Fragaria vesca subsp. vesca TaxID=101020 RepID=UPI0005C8BD0E|nr:PREDICTED: 50S ribosomal protein L1, chloroplastic isoform X1 [Fragaria vesca subsp. vesca]